MLVCFDHQVAHEKKLVLPSVARHFLLTWTFVLKVIMKDLTLVSADMVGEYSSGFVLLLAILENPRKKCDS